MSPSRLEQALNFAIEAHQGAVRDGEMPLPYVTHVVDVLNNLRYIGRELDEDVLCAALLHDTLEETAVKPRDIKRMFGDRVVGLVEELTRKEPSATEAKSLDPDALYELRTRYLLDGIAAMSPEAMKIKLADRLGNLEEAFATRRGNIRKRYMAQSREILAIIPKSVSPALWKAVKKAAS